MTNMRRRKNDSAMRIFGERNKETDAWAENGARCERKHWEENEGFVWQDVRGMCRIWDCSCRATWRAAGMLMKVFTRLFGWHTVNKNVGLCAKRTL